MVISGMEWIMRYGRRPGVVNMSLGYGDVQTVRDAAEKLVSAGFFVAAAAGNGNFAGTPENACLQSPAGAPSVMTVGATTSSDNESSFSNYGRCVDILAPGSSVVSLGIGSYTATSTRSGTSMATPHVAGVGAQYLGSYPTATPADVTSIIKSLGSASVITLHALSAHYGTPNLLLRTKF
jgi:subtilisin family serine protease